MGEEGNNFSWIFYIRVNKSNRALWICFFFINEELPKTSICTVETHRKHFISTIDVPLNFEAPHLTRPRQYFENPNFTHIKIGWTSLISTYF